VAIDTTVDDELRAEGIARDLVRAINDQRKALGDIAVPTLVLSGSKDKNAPAPMMAKMATYIPSSTYVELEGAGHLVNLEQPGAFDAALEQFLNTVKVTA